MVSGRQNSAHTQRGVQGKTTSVQPDYLFEHNEQTYSRGHKKYTFRFLKTIVILYSNYGFTTGQSTKRWFYGAT